MMMSRQSLHCVWPGLLAAIATLAAACTAAPAADKPVPSLDFLPDDAAFYVAMLRGREQWEAVAQSRAWAKLKGMPVVQMGLALYAMQAASPDSIPGKIQSALQDPDMRKHLDLAAEMFSEEAFVYGDQSFVQFVELGQKLYSSMQYGPATERLSGRAKHVSENELRMQILLSALADSSPLIKMPDLIFGFKVKNLDLAHAELDRLEKDATAALAEQPKVQQRLKRATIGGVSYLTLPLDGHMISWEEGPIGDLRKLERRAGDVDKLIARLKELTLVVAVGLRGDYLLVSIGPTTEPLARLGQGKSLRSRPELAPLARFADKRLTSVALFGKPMYAQLTNNRREIDNVLKMVDGLLASLSAPAKLQAEIRKDAAELAKDLKSLVPEPGPVAGIGFLTPSGLESYAYDWGEHRELDGTKPLALLDHVGGNPLLAAVNRTKVSVQSYDLLSKWALVGFRYFEEYGVAKMPAADRPKYDKFIAQARPLVRRFDETNRRMLLPALADGQIGFVVDAKFTTNHFIESLPPTDKPMPMIEPAVLVGVSDASLLEKAFHEYWAIANGLVDVLRGIEDTKIPADFKIPAARAIQTPQGTIYAYDLPKPWGVDPQVLPNAGLSKSVAAVSLSRGHTERLLGATPPSVAGRTLPTDRPLAGAVAMDFAGLIDGITPWIDLGIDKVGQQREAGGVAVESVRQQVHTLLDVLKVFRGFVAEMYCEDKALVTHTRTELRDVGP